MQMGYDFANVPYVPTPAREQGRECLICNFFHDNYEMEQMRGNMYNPDDAYYGIPMLIFRFSKIYGGGIYDELSKCVGKFNGNLEWAIYNRYGAKKGTGINSVLAPSEEIERQIKYHDVKPIISQRNYFSEARYKSLCDNAIADIEDLHLHIKDTFSFSLKPESR